MSLRTLMTGVNTELPWHYVVMNNVLYMTNGWDTPLAWDGSQASARRWGIEPPSTTAAPTATEGAAGNLDAGTYSYRVSFARYENGATVAESNLSGSVEVVVGASKKVELTDIPQPSAGEDVDRIYIYRTKHTAVVYTSYFYVGYVEVDTTTYTDNTADASLGTTMWTWSSQHNSAWAMPYCLVFQNRAFLAGQVRYSQGTVDITATDKTLSGTGTDWHNILLGQSMPSGLSSDVGWAIAIDGELFTNKVDTVTGAGELEMVTAAGQTLTGRSYTMWGGGEAMYGWSMALWPEYWHATSLEIAGHSDAITGLFQGQGFMGIAKATSVHVLAYSSTPDEGQLSELVRSRGALHQRVITQVDANTYMMDQFGMHRYAAGGSTEPISGAINELIQPSDEPRRVNFDYAEKFHSVYDAKHRCVVWFVVMGTDTEPHDALCYYADMGIWGHDYYNQGVTASTSGLDTEGRDRVWIGDDQGFRYLYGVGETDGADTDYTVSGTVTSGASTSLTDSSAGFPTDDAFEGVYVTVQHADGTYEAQRITGTTEHVLTTTSWTTPPAAGCSYWVGGIECEWSSPRYNADLNDRKKRWKGVRFVFVPQDTAFDVTAQFYLDHNDTAYSSWSQSVDRRDSDGYRMVKDSDRVLIRMNKSDGTVFVPFNEHSLYCKVKLSGVFANTSFDLSAIDVEPVASDTEAT